MSTSAAVFLRCASLSSTTGFGGGSGALDLPGGGRGAGFDGGAAPGLAGDAAAGLGGVMGGIVGGLPTPPAPGGMPGVPSMPGLPPPLPMPCDIMPSVRIGLGMLGTPAGGRGTTSSSPSSTADASIGSPAPSTPMLWRRLSLTKPRMLLPARASESPELRPARAMLGSPVAGAALEPGRGSAAELAPTVLCRMGLPIESTATEARLPEKPPTALPRWLVGSSSLSAPQPQPPPLPRAPAAPPERKALDGVPKAVVFAELVSILLDARWRLLGAPTRCTLYGLSTGSITVSRTSSARALVSTDDGSSSTVGSSLISLSMCMSRVLVICVYLSEISQLVPSMKR
mmetsp:Transcript_40926/g.101017  ORF Transcript_40926/g.101017 Transcript_40926/m.101017 type:complete len:343 (-) Transcript_40926:2858-3886(-)